MSRADQILALKAEGLSQSEIGRRLGITKQAVSDSLRMKRLRDNRSPRMPDLTRPRQIMKHTLYAAIVKNLEKLKAEVEEKNYGVAARTSRLVAGALHRISCLDLRGKLNEDRTDLSPREKLRLRRKAEEKARKFPPQKKRDQK